LSKVFLLFKGVTPLNCHHSWECSGKGINRSGKRESRSVNSTSAQVRKKVAQSKALIAQVREKVAQTKVLSAQVREKTAQSTAISLR